MITSLAGSTALKVPVIFKVTFLQVFRSSVLSAGCILVSLEAVIEAPGISVLRNSATELALSKQSFLLKASSPSLEAPPTTSTAVTEVKFD